MKNALGKIVTIVIVLAVGYWLFFGILSKKQVVNVEEQEVQAEKLLKIKKSVQDMVTKHNAVTDWQGSLEKDGIEPTFTIEFQDTLIRKDSRPLVFVAAVEDIVRDSNSYTAHFHNRFDLLLSADVHFVLDCTPEQVQEIMKQSNSVFENYAVVAHVTSVRKIRYRVVADGDEDVRIDSSLISNVFEATGRCLDLIHVCKYELEDLLETSSK